jgi:hypothetical protein
MLIKATHNLFVDIEHADVDGRQYPTTQSIQSCGAAGALRSHSGASVSIFA